MAAATAQNIGSRSIKKPISRPMSWLKSGAVPDTNTTASTRASRFTKADSSINCPISCRRVPPDTFRSPTSRARSSERAVVRLMWFIQAIVRVASATKISVVRVLRLPLASRSYCFHGVRCTSSAGFSTTFQVLFFRAASVL